MPNSIRSWAALKRLIETPDLPGLGPAPRAGRLPLTELNCKVDCFLEEASLPSTLHPLVRSAALLWHDYLDESHSLSQDIHTADGGFLHGGAGARSERDCDLNAGAMAGLAVNPERSV